MSQSNKRRCVCCGERMRGRFCISCGQTGSEFDETLCENCGAQKTGQFCTLCGQNEQSYRRSVFPVLREILAEAFETDSRLITTFRLLFTRPGSLSEEFSKNRRARYLSPFRLYLFASIVFFSVLSLSVNLSEEPSFPDLAALEASSDEQEIELDETGFRSQGAESAEQELTGDPNLVNTKEVDLPISGLWSSQQLEGIRRFQEILDDERRRKFWALLERPVVGPAFVDGLVGITADDYATMDAFNRYGVDQIIDILYQPGDAIEEWFEYLPIAMFCLLPFYAALLKLVYFRHDKFYAEHLVFGMHVHTVAFIVFTILLLIPSFSGSWSLYVILLVSFAIYYFFALKRYYQNGVVMTTIQYVLLSFVYLWLLALTFIGAAWALLLFF
ncbi:MAG: DUF3667 domain-containing protein [Gammaproteobacteria bacterium]|nr:DUF3667 domain-containing protein [Gammaproteobacteria bacterium]